MAAEETTDWIEWLDDIVDAIETGQLDSGLRQIVRAAITRRFPGRLVPEAVLEKHQFAYALSQAPPPKVDDGTIVDRLPSPDGLVPIAVDVPDGTTGPALFDVAGCMYRKSDAVGRVYVVDRFQLPDELLSVGRELEGATVRVIEINRVNTMLQILDVPHYQSRKLKSAWRSPSKCIVVPKGILAPILESRV